MQIRNMRLYSVPCSEHKNKPLPFEQAGALIVSGKNKIPAGVNRRDKGCVRVK